MVQKKTYKVIEKRLFDQRKYKPVIVLFNEI